MVFAFRYARKDAASGRRSPICAFQARALFRRRSNRIGAKAWIMIVSR
jgi:hypothetical protein